MFSNLYARIRTLSLVGLSAAALLNGTLVLAAECAPAQVEKGSQVFAGECGVCHSVNAGETIMGPSLHAVVGRPSGSLAGFSFSQAMKTKAVKWQAETIDQFISQPQSYVPGTYMPYMGLASAPDRAAVGCYLSKQG
ncbi:Cytochrome c2 [compost metagenome]